MPNWCNNEITITGPQADLEALLKIAEGPVMEMEKEERSLFSMQKLFPAPEKQSGVPMNGAEIARWRKVEWGTVCDILVTDDRMDGYPKDHEITFNCETAWTPPIQFFKNISVRFPTLIFRINYYEPAMLIAGIVEVNNGCIYNIPFKAVEVSVPDGTYIR